MIPMHFIGINYSTDDFSINDLLVLLEANGQGVCHQIVNEMGIALLASTDFSNAILDMVEFDEDNVGVITDACAQCRIRRRCY